MSSPSLNMEICRNSDIEEQKVGGLLDLPVELILDILQYLEARFIVNVLARVCTLFRLVTFAMTVNTVNIAFDIFFG